MQLLVNEIKYAERNGRLEKGRSDRQQGMGQFTVNNEITAFCTVET